jgi:arylsulfatase A-like enzyme
VPRTTLYWRVGERRAIRHGDWKLLRQSGAWQLYDLAHDGSEQTDRATAEPARAQELAALWETWNAEQIAPRWR